MFQLRPDFRVCPQLKEHTNKKSIKHSKQPLLRHERGQRQARADDQIHCDTDIPWCQSTPTNRMRFFLTTKGLLYMFNKASWGDFVVKPSATIQNPWGPGKVSHPNLQPSLRSFRFRPRFPIRQKQLLQNKPPPFKHQPTIH